MATSEVVFSPEIMVMLPQFSSHYDSSPTVQCKAAPLRHYKCFGALNNSGETQICCQMSLFLTMNHPFLAFIVLTVLSSVLTLSF